MPPRDLILHTYPSFFRKGKIGPRLADGKYPALTRSEKHDFFALSLTKSGGDETAEVCA